MIVKPKSCARAVARGQAHQVRMPHGYTAPAPGRIVAVQWQAGKARLCDVQIIGATEQLLGDASFDDARREGHKTTSDLLAAWRQEYGTDDPRTPTVVVLVDLAVDQPRFLHRLSERGYTHREHDALPDEPEAVPADYELRLMHGAREREQLAHNRAAHKRARRPSV